MTPNVTSAGKTKRKLTKRDLPPHCFLRGRMIWYTIKCADGEWRNFSTKFTVDQLELARNHVRSVFRAAEAEMEALADVSSGGEAPRALTLRVYIERWLKDRESRGIWSVNKDRGCLEKYVLPHLGSMPLIDLRPRHVRDMVRELRDRRLGANRIAPRSVLHVYYTLHNALECAVVDELIQMNPVKVHKGELPKKLDADPEWRSRATYTVAEVERLISDTLIPVERRVRYALKALAGMRHGEVAALCWRHLDWTTEPLARLTVAQAFCSRTGLVKSVKTEVTRTVPVHPTLAKILIAWRDHHWERVYGRKPTEDDYVAPARTMTPADASDAVIAMKDDLDALGLRKQAGKKRCRGGHDLRSWYLTRLIEDGADSGIVRRTTHASPKDVAGGYERFSWGVICREVTKLRLDLPDEKVLVVLTPALQAEANAAERWRNAATPTGFESISARASGSNQTKSSSQNGSASSTSAQTRALPVRQPLHHTLTRFSTNTPTRSPESVLQTAAKMLERALRAGDVPRALKITAKMRAMGSEVITPGDGGHR